jgi:beta-1,4-mannosyl-glycoprotein beta-1,4-N-acetylglucosaminyltransferase
MILKVIVLGAICEEVNAYQQQRDGWVYEDSKVGCVPHRNDCEHVRQEFAARWLPRLQPSGTYFTRLRTTPRLMIDLFLYNDEADMLEIRMATLNHVVDFHVPMESNHTLSGKPKTRWFADNLWQFAPNCQKKLRVYQAHSEATDVQWANEHAIRRQYGDAVSTLFTTIELGQNLDDVFVLFHDLDEIPHPELLWLFKWCDELPPTPLLFHTRFYYYTFGWRLLRTAKADNINDRDDARARPIEWTSGPTLASLSVAQQIWLLPVAQWLAAVVTRAVDAGWHCSSCLPVDTLITKLRSYSHTELAQDATLLTREWLLHAKRTGIDYALRVTRGFSVAVDALAEAPPYVTRHLSQFAYMLLAPISGSDGLPREHSILPHTRRCELGHQHTSRNIYVDAGANRGDTLELLLRSPEKFHAQTVRHWDLFLAFEGNEQLCAQLQIAGSGALQTQLVEQFISQCPVVVNVGGGNVTFYLDTHYAEGLGSSISAHHTDATFNPSKAKAVVVKAVDLVDYLEASVTEDDFVVLKIDVEGAEWAIINKLIARNATRLIDTMICEWHWYGAGGRGATPEIAAHYATAVEEMLRASNPRIDLVRWV